MTEDFELPAPIAEFKAKLCCPRCRSTRAQGQILVTVLSNHPFYQVAGSCLRCGHRGFGGILQIDGAAPEQPVRERTGEDVPLADWVRQLNLGEER